jgi:hypothetical protein
LKRLGEFESQTKKRIVENMNHIFNQAKQGGAYSKFYNRYKNEYTKRLNKATKSFDEVIAEHELWIADPSLKLGSNPPENSVRRNIKKWQEDIERNRTYKIIIQGIIEGRK